MNIKQIRKNRGFTMIELIIVIAILGILAAFALPRFADFTSSAKSAAREGVVSSLNSGIAIAHAKWIANGSTGNVTLDGGAVIPMNATTGYPDIPTTIKTTADCQALVTSLVSGTASTLNVAYDSTNSVCTVDSTKNWATKITLSSQAAN